MFTLDSTSRASALPILYPPVKKHDLGSGTGAKARYELDDPTGDLENALANTSVYSDPRLDSYACLWTIMTD